MKTYAIALTIMILAVSASATIVFEDDFDGYTGAFSQKGWTGGTSSKFSHPTSGGVNNSSHVRIEYNEPGTSPYWFGKSVPDLAELSVAFHFKTINEPTGGAKFLKIFGRNNEPEGYANSTFGLSPWGGCIEGVAYGDGSGTSNDTQAVIKFSGTKTDSQVVLQLYSGSNFTPRNNTWHSYQIFMKYNHDDQRDGEYKSWIDGTLMLHATNVKNRHNANFRGARSVELANYCNGTYYETPWTLCYDNVEISTDASIPEPPPPQPADDPPPPDPDTDPPVDDVDVPAEPSETTPSQEQTSQAPDTVVSPGLSALYDTDEVNVLPNVLRPGSPVEISVFDISDDPSADLRIITIAGDVVKVFEPEELNVAGGIVRTRWVPEELGTGLYIVRYTPTIGMPRTALIVSVR